MLAYTARRLLIVLVTLLCASAVVFFVLEIVPGDPARLMLGLNASDAAVQALREQMGLNEPVLIRYFAWLGGMARGDFGTSLTYSVPVIELIGERVMVSVPLALIALVMSTAIAIPLGIFTAARRGRPADTAAMAGAQLGIAIPNFWFALLLVWVFAITLQWLPAGGFPGWSDGLWPGLSALLLPAVALALPQAAILTRITRSALIETLAEDYVRTARAKGLPARVVLWRHALRNALIPVLTILGLQFAFLLAGTIIIENVFYLPGLGRLVFQAIGQRDLIVVEGVVVLLVATVVFVNFLVDLAYGWADPRLRRR
ncbi:MULTISPECIES: ABC transporter permease [unclassified Roseitalea]|uniref:ABC transporter permease n=1 Tax=unclassified Roseitalea TaxID=2639107 RepID=UPI00273F80C4|nr:MULTISPECIES: ABC transporter permease [unclassified Roseitalea]